MTEVVVFAELQAKDGKEQEFLAAFVPVIDENRRDPGCITFDVHRALERRGLFLVHEVWRDRAALERHLAMPHVAVFLEKVAAEELAVLPPITLSEKVY